MIIAKALTFVVTFAMYYIASIKVDLKAIIIEPHLERIAMLKQTIR